jgi:hypothetical protein
LSPKEGSMMAFIGSNDGFNLIILIESIQSKPSIGPEGPYLEVSSIPIYYVLA